MRLDPDSDPDKSALPDFRSLFQNKKSIMETLGLNRMRNVYRGSGTPKVLCINERTEKQYKFPAEFKDHCKQDLTRPESDSFAMHVAGTPWIFICESFFNPPILPPSTREVPKSKVCFTWDPNLLLHDGRGATAYECFYYQAFMFIHECIHFYVPDALNDISKPKEIYVFSEGLIARQSSDLRRNPMNYQVYAASKSSLTVNPLAS